MATLTDKKSIPAVIKEMTLEEKARLLTGGTSHTTYAIPRLGIPSAHYLDGATGISYSQYFSNMVSTHRLKGKPMDESLSGMSGWGIARRLLDHWDCPEELTEGERGLLEEFQKSMKETLPSGKKSSCFPAGMLLGATWDKEAVYGCGKAMGKEADAYQIDVLLGPNINIQRDPLNGRLFEAYSEDPYLTGELASEYISGVQSEGLGACVKHFAANNQETDRRGVDEKIPQRALREIYFPGFRTCVERGVKAVMSAYNKINGALCASDPWLLTDLLRGEWGFEGAVISDWGAVVDRVASIQAGNTVDMPGPKDPAPILEALKSGRLTEEDLDRNVEAFLTALLELPVMNGRKNTDIDRGYSAAAAYRAVSEGCVLLKNENSALPLRSGANVALFGEGCKRFIECGSGSAEVVTDQHGSLYASLADRLGVEHVSFGETADQAETVIAALSLMGREGADRADMKIPQTDKEFLHGVLQQAKAGGRKTVLLLNICGPVELDGLEELSDAVMCVFIPGMAGGEAVADLLVGKTNPSGKLPLTFPKRYEDCPSFRNFPGYGKEVWYGEGIYVGYRYYDVKKVEPLYPFGFGLSYSSFALSKLEMAEVWEAGRPLTVSVAVKNCGPMDGKEVVQLYLRHENPTLDKPDKELKAFQKVFLKAGEEKKIMFQLDQKVLECWDPKLGAWAAEPGYYQVLIGTSSRDISCTGRVKARGLDPYAYGEETRIEKILEDARSAKALRGMVSNYRLSEQELDDLLRETLQFRPESPLGAVWDTIIAPMMDVPEEEKRSAKESLMKQLAEIERIV